MRRAARRDPGPARLLARARRSRMPSPTSTAGRCEPSTASRSGRRPPDPSPSPRPGHPGRGDRDHAPARGARRKTEELARVYAELVQARQALDAHRATCGRPRRPTPPLRPRARGLHDGRARRARRPRPERDPARHTPRSRCARSATRRSSACRCAARCSLPPSSGGRGERSRIARFGSSTIGDPWSRQSTENGSSSSRSTVRRVSAAVLVVLERHEVQGAVGPAHQLVGAEEDAAVSPAQERVVRLLAAPARARPGGGPGAARPAP